MVASIPPVNMLNPVGDWGAFVDGRLGRAAKMPAGTGKGGADFLKMAAPIGDGGGEFPEGGTPIHVSDAPIANGGAPIADNRAPIQNICAPVTGFPAPIGKGGAPIDDISAPIGKVERDLRARFVVRASQRSVPGGHAPPARFRPSFPNQTQQARPEVALDR